VFHLIHYTFGYAHPTHRSFDHTTVYANVVTGFPSLWLVLFYLAAMAALGLHLYHGTGAMLMSLGASHPRFTPRWRRAAAVIAILVAVGFAVIPLAAHFHFIR
jgi:succinate dehydrogenase / fumarate reductase cytochrome b subunit